MIVDTGLAADLDRDLDGLLARDREALTKTIRDVLLNQGRDRLE